MHFDLYLQAIFSY